MEGALDRPLKFKILAKNDCDFVIFSQMIFEQTSILQVFRQTKKKLLDELIAEIKK